MTIPRTMVTRFITVLGIICLLIDLVAHHHIGPIIWVWLCYLFVAFLALTDFTVLPKRQSPFCKTLTDDEFRLFRAYHVSLTYPPAADMYSAGLNTFSMIGVFFGVMAFVGHGYITGGLLIFYFLVANAYQLRTAPMEHTVKAAAKGQPMALWRTEVMEIIQKKLLAYRSAGTPS